MSNLAHFTHFDPAVLHKNSQKMATGVIVELKTVPLPTPDSWKPREASSSKIAGACLSKEPRGGDKSAEALYERDLASRSMGR